MCFNGLVQDCSISIANTLEILQSCTKPLICNKPSMPFLNHCLTLKYRNRVTKRWNYDMYVYIYIYVCMQNPCFVLHNPRWRQNVYKWIVNRPPKRLFLKIPWIKSIKDKVNIWSSSSTVYHGVHLIHPALHHAHTATSHTQRIHARSNIIAAGIGISPH